MGAAENEHRQRSCAPRPSALIRDLLESYPELASFTPDATLLEIKTRYGLASLEQLRELGRRRERARSGHAGARGDEGSTPGSDRSRTPRLTPVEPGDEHRRMPETAQFGLEVLREGRGHRVVLRGELDLRRAPRLESTVARLCLERTRSLRIDLRDVTFIDSRGVHALLGTGARCRESSCELAVIPSDHEGPRRTLELLGLGAPWC